MSTPSPDGTSPAQQLIPGTVRVYVTTFCPYCVAAKRWLTTRGVPYEVVDASTDPTTRYWLVEKSGMRTVPQIFVGEHSVGGYTDMVAMDERGEFFPLLDAQGIARDR